MYLFQQSFTKILGNAIKVVHVIFLKQILLKGKFCSIKKQILIKALGHLMNFLGRGHLLMGCNF